MKSNIGRLVSILHRQAQVYINSALKEFDITSAEYAFLLHLYRKDGITQEDLSTYLSIDKSATARAIRSLEKKGFIVRNKDDVDRRCNRVYLSDKAKQYKSEIRQRIWRWSDFLTDEMDEETKNIVISALENMVKKVERTNLKQKLEEY